MRARTADTLIKTGFWIQPVLLLLVDAATVHAMATQDVAWIHYPALLAVNIVLIGLTAFIGVWLIPRRSRSATESQEQRL